MDKIISCADKIIGCVDKILSCANKMFSCSDNLINTTIVNLSGSNTDNSFSVDNSNSSLSSYEILSIDQENKYTGYFREIFIFYHENICCVYSLESPHRDESNEYTQHTIFCIDYLHLLPDLKL